MLPRASTGSIKRVASVLIPNSTTTTGTRVLCSSPRVHETNGDWLTHDTINVNLKVARYAVRGEMVIRAAALNEKLKTGELHNGKKLPFNRLTFCNIGNPQELRQKPITFGRQIAAILNYPQILESPHVESLFPADVIARAKMYLSEISGGLGSYTHSQGIEVVRKEVADFIARRDGFPANANDIFLSDGASPAVQFTLKAILREKNDAIMVPIPQYPLYSASIALYGGTMVNYYLDENKEWGLSLEELERSLHEARDSGKNVRAIVIINPGNPTGNCLKVENIREIIAFASQHKLIVMADEVYQDNIWDSSRPFVSFKKVAAEMGLIDPKNTTVNHGLQLVSFHSTSKGFTGECGRRGGYKEIIGFDEDVRGELYKLASISLCPNSNGQIGVGVMVNPPRPGEPSYELYESERDSILASLRRRAQWLGEAFNKLEGVTCNSPQGALYAFPRIRLPKKAVEAAAEMGKLPDAFYCIKLLEATGVVVVPGSGFEQEDGTFHFRTTILPQEDDIIEVIDRMTKFHKEFMDEYRTKGEVLS